MKRTLLLIIGLAFGIIANGQSVYYGYPNGKELKKGDLIIVSLPEHLHMRFSETEQTASLYQFLKDHNKNKFTILIHLFLDSPEYDFSVSEHLKKSLEAMLAQKCQPCNVIVTAKGQSSPIFLQEQDTPLYRRMNTRMEIVVE